MNTQGALQFRKPLASENILSKFQVAITRNKHALEQNAFDVFPILKKSNEGVRQVKKRFQIQFKFMFCRHPLAFQCFLPHLKTLSKTGEMI